MIINDSKILEALDRRILIADIENGLVFAINSNTPHFPAGSLTSKGYIRVGFTINKKRYNTMGHRIIWIAKWGLPPTPEFQINHKNGIKSDNKISNLEMGDQYHNMAHAKNYGLLRPRRGEIHGQAKLTNSQIDEIKRRNDRGDKTKNIARDYGVTPTQIRNIVTGRRWTPNQTCRVGKKAAGRILDGRTWEELPE